MSIFEAFLLGVLEGLTEFLPVSSTGHLILASTLLGIEQSSAHKTFEITIQLGSILAVVYLYRDKLFSDFELWKKLIVAFIPTGIIGLLFYKHIKELFIPETVALMLILGGIVFIVVERFYNYKEHNIDDVSKITYKKAFFVGLFQSIAMIPGTSRSGATIIGGLLLGLNRKTAAEFSFLLAVPTMFVATFYDIYKNFEEVTHSGIWGEIAIGFVVSFFFAIIAIKSFIAFLSRFSFVPFGIYRILLGLIFFIFIF